MADDTNNEDRMEGLGPERKAALMQLDEAKKRAQKGPFEEAIELAHEALEKDPSFTEARHWIADQLIEAGEIARASKELQEIVSKAPDDTAAWDKLREIAPQTAERLERLKNIAPDPFVARRERKAAESDLFDDLGDMDEDEQFQEVEEEYMLEYSDEEDGTEGAPIAEDELEGFDIKDREEIREEQLSAGPSSEPEDVLKEAEARFGDAEDIEPGDAPEGTVGGEEPKPQEDMEPPDLSMDEDADLSLEDEGEEEEKETQVTREPQAAVPWAFEQDYEFRRRLDASPGVPAIVEALEDIAEDFDAWDQVMVSSAHMNAERHPEVYSAFEEAAEFFDVEMPEVFLAPERRVCPIVVRANPGAVTMTTGVMKAMNADEMRFIVGRLMSHFALDDHEYHHIVTIVLQRTPMTITDIEQARLDVLSDHATGWDIGVSREERQKLTKLVHAWQQRNELSADRGGLLFCGDIKTACTAIAKSTCRDGEEAGRLDYNNFVKEYKDHDPSDLADIEPKEDPLRSPQYGAYRILMLKWWASTDQYRALTQA
ncbi:MAG: tetratricopeptide repeat protein [Armatimonadota bacterium]